MSKEIELIENLIKEHSTISYSNKSNFDILKKRTQMIIRNIFGENSHYLEELKKIRYGPTYVIAGADNDYRTPFENGLRKFGNILNVMKEEIEMKVNLQADDIAKEIVERKIFISHSSLDADIVGKLIELIEAMGLPSDKIFCTSFEGYNIGLGEDFLQTIRDVLSKEVLVIFVLSKNFYESPISLCEMGATWVKTKEHIPVLVPPFEYKEIKGVIPYTQGMKVNEKGKLNSLKEKIESFFSLNAQNFSIWERKRDKILGEINLALDSRVISKPTLGAENERQHLPKRNKPKDSLIVPEEVDSMIKNVAKAQWPVDFGMQVYIIEEQRKAYLDYLKFSPDDIEKDSLDRIKFKADE
jgi:hypothetical protein